MFTSTPPENADDVYEWLSQFINPEPALNRKNFSIDNMKRLADLSGHPEQCAPSVHVAGSKGKGSVTGMIASILEASGIKTACYASPHVSDFRERLALGKGFFSEETYALAGKELMEYAESLTRETGEAPAFFELLTLWFFLCARRVNCGAMAVETGMGGRLDSTNILDPLVSVITLIELEHTEILGNTIAAIAGEKAGIIKPSRPLVLAEQPPDALKVFRERAALLDSPLVYFPDRVDLKDVRVDKRGTSFTLVLKSLSSQNGGFQNGAAEPTAGDETLPGLFLPMPGEIQAKNAGLAVLTVKTAFPRIGNKSIYEGLAAFSLPARFERISDEPPVVIDGAHTKQSVDNCAKTFTSLYGRGGVLVFGCAAGKDVQSMAELCIPCFSAIIITTPGSFKKSFPEEIYAAFVQKAGETGNGSGGSSTPEITFIPDTDEAITRAVNLARRKNIPVLGTGSFYLAGEIRDRLKP